MTALVFIAGPLSGLIVQPLVGNLADRSTSKFGRRRPYMLFGCITAFISFLLLGFTRSFASLFVAGPSESVSIGPDDAKAGGMLTTVG